MIKMKHQIIINAIGFCKVGALQTPGRYWIVHAANNPVTFTTL